MGPGGAGVMESRIFAYRLEVKARQMIHLPDAAEFLCVAADEQREVPILYYRVPEGEWPAARKIIRVVTTGDTFNSEGCTFLGLVTIKGWFRAFIFEQRDGAPDPVDERSVADFEAVAGLSPEFERMVGG